MLMPTESQRYTGKFFGKYSGEVTDNQDDEKAGQIMVTVPNVFGPELQVKARPCLPFGHFYIPAIGTKVWIEFEGGDPGYPIWVGVWYASGKTPPQADINPPDNRVIQTPSGHTIELMDKDGEEKITIRHKGNAFIAIDKQGSVTIANQEGSNIYLNAKDGEATFMEQHGHLVTMKSDSVLIAHHDGTAIELKSDKVRLIAAGSVEVTAKDVILNSSTVGLGQNATSEAAILGTTFGTIWNQFLAAYASHTHPSAAPGPPSPPTPVPPFTPAPTPTVLLAPLNGLSQAVKLV